jgi:hypothetical protein
VILSGSFAALLPVAPGALGAPSALGGLVDVCLALGVAAGPGDPEGDPRAQRLVTPYDRFDGLSADGTEVFFAAHFLRVGRSRTQRFLLYVRTRAPLPNVRTDSRVNSEIAKPEPNIGMPEPYTSG